jgi:hypothetical protein
MITITSAISSSSESFPDFCSSFFSPSSSSCVSFLESSELLLLLTLIDIHIATAYNGVKDQDKKLQVNYIISCCFTKSLNWYCSMIFIYFRLFGSWCLMPLSTTFQLYHGGSVFLVEETGVPAENYRSVTSH